MELPHNVRSKKSICMRERERGEGGFAIEIRFIGLIKSYVSDPIKFNRIVTNV